MAAAQSTTRGVVTAVDAKLAIRPSGIEQEQTKREEPESYRWQMHPAAAGRSATVPVIGITGATRSGKGWVSSAVSAALGGVTVVGQDSFWRGPRRSPNGKLSQEEPECTDHAAFAAAVRQACRQAKDSSTLDGDT